MENKKKNKIISKRKRSQIGGSIFPDLTTSSAGSVVPKKSKYIVLPQTYSSSTPLSNVQTVRSYPIGNGIVVKIPSTIHNNNSNVAAAAAVSVSAAAAAVNNNKSFLNYKLKIVPSALPSGAVLPKTKPILAQEWKLEEECNMEMQRMCHISKIFPVCPFVHSSTSKYSDIFNAVNLGMPDSEWKIFNLTFEEEDKIGLKDMIKALCCCIQYSQEVNLTDQWKCTDLLLDKYDPKKNIFSNIEQLGNLELVELSKSAIGLKRYGLFCLCLCLLLSSKKSLIPMVFRNELIKQCIKCDTAVPLLLIKIYEKIFLRSVNNSSFSSFMNESGAWDVENQETLFERSIASTLQLAMQEYKDVFIYQYLFWFFDGSYLVFPKVRASVIYLIRRNLVKLSLNTFIHNPCNHKEGLIMEGKLKMLCLLGRQALDETEVSLICSFIEKFETGSVTIKRFSDLCGGFKPSVNLNPTTMNLLSKRLNFDNYLWKYCWSEMKVNNMESLLKLDEFIYCPLYYIPSFAINLILKMNLEDGFHISFLRKLLHHQFRSETNYIEMNVFLKYLITYVPKCHLLIDVCPNFKKFMESRGLHYAAKYNQLHLLKYVNNKIYNETTNICTFMYLAAYRFKIAPELRSIMDKEFLEAYDILFLLQPSKDKVFELSLEGRDQPFLEKLFFLMLILKRSELLDEFLTRYLSKMNKEYICISMQRVLLSNSLVSAFNNFLCNTYKFKKNLSIIFKLMNYNSFFPNVQHSLLVIITCVKHNLITEKYGNKLKIDIFIKFLCASDKIHQHDLMELMKYFPPRNEIDNKEFVEEDLVLYANEDCLTYLKDFKGFTNNCFTLAKNRITKNKYPLFKDSYQNEIHEKVNNNNDVLIIN